MYIVKEEDIMKTVNDFEVFCGFIEENKPILTIKKAELNKKDLFNLNSLLHFKKDVSAPNYTQGSYHLIDLMFNFAINGNLYIREADSKGKVRLKGTSGKKTFDEFNIFEKYAFLFETFWTRFDLAEYIQKSYLENPIDTIIRTFAKSAPGEVLKNGAFAEGRKMDHIFSTSADMIYCFNYFGFNDYVPVVQTDKKYPKYEPCLESVIPTELGVSLSKILLKNNIKDWNLSLHNYQNMDNMFEMISEMFGISKFKDFTNIHEEKKQKKAKNTHLYEHLKVIFPKGSLNRTVSFEKEPVIGGNFIFKVSLGARVWRKIAISSECTLEDLHNAIQWAFSFDNDHLYAFYMDGKRYSKNSYKSPMCGEGPFVHDITIGELGLYVGQKILYLFDFGDSWEFNVVLTEFKENEPLFERPEVIERKGEAPRQYMWDEDEDEDDEY